jgi:hypothetical protein
MKVGDIVRCKRLSQTWADGLDAGIGLIVQMETYDPTGNLSIHVQWPTVSLWYEEADLEVVNENTPLARTNCY